MKTYHYKGIEVVKKYRQWYSSKFEGSFSTLTEFRRYIDALIARGKYHYQ